MDCARCRRAEISLSKTQRTKGASYEREVCDVFSKAFGDKITRNIGQARDGGNDIDLPPFLIECKRRKTLGTVYGWLQQAIASIPAFQRRHPSKTTAPIPIVVCREDNGESLVVLRLSDFVPIARNYAIDVALKGVL